MKNKSTFGFLWQIMGKNRKFFVLAVICMLISVCFTYISPILVGTIVDSVVGTKPFDLPQPIVNVIESIGGREFLFGHLYICALVYLLFVGLSGLFNGLRTYFSALLSEGISITLRKRIHSHILKLPFKWHMESQTGDTLQRCTTDIETVRNFIAIQMTDLVRVISMIAVAFTLMFMLHVPLASIAFATIPVSFFVSFYFFKKIRKSYRLTEEAEGALSSATQEAFQGVRVVKAFGREKYTLDNFKKLNKKYSELWIQLGKMFAVHWSFGDFMRQFQVAVVVVAGVVFVVKGSITAGNFVTFMMYIRTVTRPTRLLARIIADMGKVGVSIDRLRQILDLKEETLQPHEGEYKVKGDIVFNNVSFSYEDGKVLDDISFTIKEGETFAILGGTGSGKSTITYLLTRLYDPDSGTITIGGRDIKTFERMSLRRQMGLILQEPFLFSKTIMENLRMLYPDAKDEEIFEATETAAVHRSILSFPNGYETLLGERGVTLSGGQKQRVAIARTLAANPPVLIFDDSLSAVDTETDAHIRKALKQRDNKVTTIIISHRATTLMEADRILVLKDGKVSQLGTHEELLKKEGIYARIWNIQSMLEDELSDKEGE